MSEAGEAIVPCPAEQQNWLVWLQYSRGQLDITSHLLQANEHNEFLQAIKARLHFESGRWQEAIEAFHFCNKIDPDNIEYVKYIGKSLLKQGRHRLALEVLTRAASMAHQDWETYYLMAECWWSWSAGGLVDPAAGTAEAAINCARRAAHNAQAHNTAAACLTRLKLAEILSKSGKLDDAIAVYEEAISISGGLCAPAMAACGALRASRSARSPPPDLPDEDTRRAFALLSGALASDPGQRDAALALAAVMQQNGERAASMSRYRSLLADDPLSVAILNNVAVSYHDAGKYLAAMWCLSRCYWRLPQGGDSRRVRSNACRALLAAKRFPAAAAAATVLAVDHQRLHWQHHLLISACLLGCCAWKTAAQAAVRALRAGAPAAHARALVAAMKEGAAEDPACQLAVQQIMETLSEVDSGPLYEEIDESHLDSQEIRMGADEV